jgi:hypothetical protein
VIRAQEIGKYEPAGLIAQGLCISHSRGRAFERPLRTQGGASATDADADADTFECSNINRLTAADAN